jgi:hypothetical protein
MELFGRSKSPAPFDTTLKLIVGSKDAKMIEEVDF